MLLQLVCGMWAAQRVSLRSPGRSSHLLFPGHALMTLSAFNHLPSTSAMNLRRILGVLHILLLGGMVAGPLWAQPEAPPKLDDRFKIRNIGFVVNTSDLEYAPTVSIDGRTLYFVSNRP